MSITWPLGFRAAGATAGLKPSGKPDLCLIVRDGASDPARTGSAACFTSSQIVGAPVIIGREARAGWLSGGAPLRAVLVNAGNSNAATGAPGVTNAKRCMAGVAKLIGCDTGEVLPSSTGVIGRPLAVEKIEAALSGLASSLGRGERADAAAAQAIMTTDLVPKTASWSGMIGGREVRIGAIAKGSGMIAPRMDLGFRSAARGPEASATMLAFVTTDAAISSADLQRALDSASARSFNRISVDNHPSCSDTVVAMASGAAGGGQIRAGTAAFDAFAAALGGVCRDLSEQIVTDGEGATRIFEVRVRGAKSERDAEAIAREVVNSPLVKCAIHGQDPNWGRIVTAAGNAGMPMDADRTALSIGGVEVYANGVPVMPALSDPRLQAAMAVKRVEVDLIVGAGPGEAWMIGCDLSKQYVVINAEYTT